MPEAAEWAGHSPEILLKIYAKCVDGGAETHRRRIDRFLGAGQRTDYASTRLHTHRALLDHLNIALPGPNKART
ncbi:MAG: hypothetical protein GEV12_23540 [Micromonosporaceae bacterium]|nr:hypothetical protein [Micromonosporaceae bacterium]